LESLLQSFISFFEGLRLEAHAEKSDERLDSRDKREGLAADT
jgi:hypothetical protein